MTNRSRWVHWYFDYYSHTPLYGHPLNMDTSLERFSYDLDKKRANKTEIERFDWFIERIQTRVAFGGLFLKLHARELSRNQPRLRFEIILQHDSVTIGQSNNAFSILVFSLVVKRRGHVLIFSSIGYYGQFSLPLTRPTFSLQKNQPAWYEDPFNNITHTFCGLLSVRRNDGFWRGLQKRGGNGASELMCVSSLCMV